MLKLQFRDQPEKFVKLSLATVTLGRDEGNDVVIDSPSVSDFHAEITTGAQHPLIVDLLSANGTFVNERRVSGRCPLKAWDVIRLGTVEFEVTDPVTHRPEDWVLRTESDLLASQFHALQARTVVGREPGCDLIIDSNMLSRRHAELIIEGDHLKVIDLGSANGTYLNGEKIEEADARPGDELCFDKQKFIVIGPSPAQLPGREAAEERTVLRPAAGDETIIDSGPVDDTPVPAMDGSDAGGCAAPTADEETLLYQVPPPTAVLAQINAGGEPHRIVLENERQQIGRGEDCDIVLDEKSVSKLHGEFAFKHGAWFVRDLGSSNGVLVNGERIDEIELRTGDRVQLGRLEFDFRGPEGEGEEREPVTMIFQPPREDVKVDRGVVGRLKNPEFLINYRWFGLIVLLGVVASAVLLWFASR